MKTLYDFIPGAGREGGTGPHSFSEELSPGNSLPENPESGTFRKEQKYLCSFMQMQEMRIQLSGVMERDPHVGADGTYRIRSIYFDTPDDLCVQQNEDGVDERSKWRIRIYNEDRSSIFLECKDKIHDMTRKESCRISEAEFRELVGKAAAGVPRPANPLLNRFRYLQRTMGFRPAVIVRYQREPFVCRYGNVRVTRDFALESSLDFGHFFDPALAARPVFPKGVELLEVKYDEFLPAYLRQAIQTRDMQQISFSKYYLCRRYGIRRRSNEF